MLFFSGIFHGKGGGGVFPNAKWVFMLSDNSLPEENQWNFLKITYLNGNGNSFLWNKDWNLAWLLYIAWKEKIFCEFCLYIKVLKFLHFFCVIRKQNRWYDKVQCTSLQETCKSLL